MMVEKIGEEIRCVKCDNCNSLLTYDNTDIQSDQFSHSLQRRFIVCPECGKRIYLNLKQPPLFVKVYKLREGYTL